MGTHERLIIRQRALNGRRVVRRCYPTGWTWCSQVSLEQSVNRSQVFAKVDDTRARNNVLRAVLMPARHWHCRLDVVLAIHQTNPDPLLVPRRSAVDCVWALPIVCTSVSHCRVSRPLVDDVRSQAIQGSQLNRLLASWLWPSPIRRQVDICCYYVVIDNFSIFSLFDRSFKCVLTID